MHVEIQIYKYSETAVICLKYFTHLNVHLAGCINFNLNILDFRNHSFMKSYIYIFRKMCIWSSTVLNVINRGNNTLMIQY